MIGTMTSRLAEMFRKAETSTPSRSRNARRFQVGTGLEGLEGRLAPAAGFGQAAFAVRGVEIGGIDNSQRDLVTVGLPTNADLEETVDLAPAPGGDDPVTMPVDLAPAPTFGGDEPVTIIA